MAKLIKFLSSLAVLMIAVTLNGCTGADDYASDDDHGHDHADGEDAGDEGDVHVHGENCTHGDDEHDEDGDDEDGDDEDGDDEHGDDEDGDEDGGHVHDENCTHDDDDDGDDHGDDVKDKSPKGPSADESSAVKKQQTCPVTDALLGSMGKPYKITLTGSNGESQDVYLCCKGCETTIKADPDKYLAKLDK
jgi:hypothetical protein